MDKKDDDEKKDEEKKDDLAPTVGLIELVSSILNLPSGIQKMWNKKTQLILYLF